MLNRITPGRETPNAHLIYQGIEAVYSAKHFPYVIPREAAFLVFFPERSGSLMVDQVPLDESVNQMEYLRLYTPDSFLRHIGNTLSWEVVRETEKPQTWVEDETQES